jgi:hypothetical protein
MKITGDGIFYTVLCIIVVVAIAFGVKAGLHADKVAQEKHDFQIVCESNGGHAATFNEGETYVCIRDGKVIDR